MDNTPATYANISEGMRAIVDAIHAEGLTVYMRKSKDTWMHFTDGTRIGYVQIDRMRGVSISTCHVPNKNCGTGFGIERRHDGKMNQQDIADSFAIAPHWAYARDRESVVKFKNWEAFVKSATYNLDYVRIDATGTL